MSIGKMRSELQHALLEWRDAGGPVSDVTDYIEGLISAKVDEILQAREDNKGALGKGKDGG